MIRSRIERDGSPRPAPATGKTLVKAPVADLKLRRERMHMRKRRPEFWLRIIFLTWTDATERSHGLPGIVTSSPGRDRGAQREG